MAAAQKTTANSARFDGLLQAVRQVWRAIARATSSDGLREETVEAFAPAIFTTASIEFTPSLLRDVSVDDSKIVVPLLRGRDCMGLLTLEGISAGSGLGVEEIQLLRDLGESLNHGFRALEQGDDLSHQQRLLQDLSRLGQIGGWNFNALTGRGTWTEEVARIHDLEPDCPIDVDSGLDYYHTCSKPVITEAVARAISHGESFDLELEIITAKGVRKWIRTLGKPVVEGGRVVKIEGIFQDISARKASERSLLNSRARADSLFEHAGIGLSETHPVTGRYLRVNRKLCEILGYSAEELLEKRWPEITHPDDLQGDLRSFADLREGPYSSTARDKRYLRQNGSVVWTRVNGARLLRDDGSIDCVITSVEDISEFRRTDAALRESMSQIQAIIDIAPLGMAQTEPQTGAFVSVNKRFCAITGYSAEELMTMTVNDINHPEDRVRDRHQFTQVVKGERSEYDTEKRYVRKDGTVAIVHVHMTALRDDDGKPTRTLGVVEDITAQRATKDQLLAAQRMDAVGKLAGGVAHDFNNLLTVILSYTELAIAEISAESPLRADLKEVLAAGRRAEALTRQLLAFSRRQMMTMQAVDVNELLGSMEKMLVRLIGEDIALEVNPGDDLYAVRADRSQLEQVVMNLAVNARDAMAGPGGRLSMSTANVTVGGEQAAALDITPGDYVELSVADTGVGMDSATLAKIFEPFFTTKPAGQGTGLGLSMVHGIVHQSAGAIAVRSIEGHGSEFRIYLKRCDQDLQPRLPVSETADGGGSETVLVVEDEPALLNLARRTLTRSGYKVLSAANGGEAFMLCEKRGAEIDLVLSDVVMPGISGPDLLVRLRSLCPKARFLLMSGYPNDALRDRGVIGYQLLKKPFDAPGLRGAVRTALDRATPGA